MKVGRVFLERFEGLKERVMVGTETKGTRIGCHGSAWVKCVEEKTLCGTESGGERHRGRMRDPFINSIIYRDAE